MKIEHWTARRSGAHMTVTGADADTGAYCRLTNIVTIDGPLGGYAAVAVDAEGNVHELTLTDRRTPVAAPSHAGKAP